MRDNELNVDIFVYNELIDGAIRCRKFDIAWDLFIELSDKGVKPYNYIYIALIRTFSTKGILDKEKKLFSEMEESWYKLNSNTFNDLLGGHLLKKQYVDVEMLLHKMAEIGFHLKDTTWTLLHQSIATRSLSTTFIKFIRKLDPEYVNTTRKLDLVMKRISLLSV
uniref:Pentatricopeptide repeat-containing protein n=1 Tax=Tanacetum cinerariifolium TaxID=118510 RepID=A0A6L2NHS9_TANCI|nr:hypothetical protein [Tanacetum cinerariifolium]